jgi:hypothetical protein
MLCLRLTCCGALRSLATRSDGDRWRVAKRSGGPLGGYTNPTKKLIESFSCYRSTKSMPASAVVQNSPNTSPLHDDHIYSCVLWLFHRAFFVPRCPKPVQLPSFLHGQMRLAPLPNDRHRCMYSLFHLKGPTKSRLGAKSA